jgi:hypothetical protein
MSKKWCPERRLAQDCRFIPTGPEMFKIRQVNIGFETAAGRRC